LEVDASLVPVIGIGASAGGLEAFSELLSRMPAQCGVAFVVVQHLDPTHDSLLSGLLAKKCPLPVLQLGKRVRVQPDRVFVVPPGRSLKLTKGFLYTGALPRSSGGSSLIDEFFVSLAHSRGKRAVGVLLSGGGRDGVAGLEAIQAAGGTTLCQSPSSAHISGMPQAAVSARAADLVLDVPELAEELVRIGRTLGGGAMAAVDGQLLPVGGGGLAGVLAALRSVTGLDFSTYKPSTVKRRLARRMSSGKFDSIPSYVRHLLSDPREASDLAEDLLIHVTRFFRDPATFASMQRVALPRLTRERGPHEPLRIWVPGCATGEEAYSIAISVLEYLGSAALRPPIQIFGTDISELAIAKARAGLYPERIRADVPAALLRKYFTKVEGGYQIARQVRSLCAFARHDVTLDPPFSRLDLISCRNVLIYHTAEAQQRTLSMLHYALLPNGVLVLGSSESIGAKPDLFAALAPRERIFVKKAARTHATFRGAVPEPTRVHASVARIVTDSTTIALLACKEADRVLLGRFAPASVLVDRDLQILQFRGQPGPYISPASGAASLSMLKMVHPSLSSELHQSLRPLKGGAIKASSSTVAIDLDGQSLEIRVDVLPIHVSQTSPGHALVVFHSLPVQRLAQEPVGKARARSPIERLKRELATARDHLQSLIAEHQVANEALQAALESGQSANEELQSTNEELETAKEELQSTNEELSTVNDELQVRNLELNQLNSDLVHVLASIDMPILTLGRDLRVRRFNAAAKRLLNLLPGDIGRSLAEVRIGLSGIDLLQVVGQVIKGGQHAEVEVSSGEGFPYLLHARPYPAGAGDVDGVIVTFVAGRVPPVERLRASAGKARARRGA
jgi:two-component system, chemotaxis family, CheB/CheR fusion protein